MKKTIYFVMMLLIGIMTSCKDLDHYLSSPDNTDDRDSYEETTSENYYINHSWGSGADSDWAWKEMIQERNGTYTYEGLWGGVGVKINTTANDYGSISFDMDAISGYSKLAMKDRVKFTYRPTNKSLSAEKTQSGGGTNMAKVRFYRRETYMYCTVMAIEQFNEFVAQYKFADNQEGYSSYFYVRAGTSYPRYWDGSTWWLALDDPYTYYFEAGKRYTFSCSDDGTYLVFRIILEGTFNTPSQVVAERVIPKTQLNEIISGQK